MFISYESSNALSIQ